jgi:hypothetical protein
MKMLRLYSLAVLLFLSYSNVAAIHAKNHCNYTHPTSYQTARGDSILIVDAVANPSSGPAVLKVLFSAEASGGTSQGYTYFWDFDNSDGIQMDGFGQEVTYPFGHPGTYTVTVRAWDDASNYGVKEITVQVDSGTYIPSPPIVIQDTSFPAEDPFIIEGLEISSDTSIAIFLMNVENVIIRRNWIHDCVSFYPAIVVEGLSREITIEENLFEDNNGAILAPCESCYVGYNVIERTSYEWGFWNAAVSMGGLFVDNVIVEGNLILHTGPTYEYDNPDLQAFITPVGPIYVGGINCVVRRNFVFESMGGILACGDFPGQPYTEQIYIEGNVVRNTFPWVEPGIAFMAVKDGRISGNYVDMNWHGAITASASQNIEISNNIMLGAIDLIDSDQTSVHHNSVIYHPLEPPEILSHVGPPGVFGILVSELWPEFIQPEGDPAHSEGLLIADNLISGCQNGIQAANGIGIWTDWNCLGWLNPDSLDDIRNLYLRVIDRSGTAVIGKNNLIAIPQFIDPDYGNYLLVVGDPLSNAGHDGGPIGAIWTDILPTAPDTSDIILGIPGPELLENGDAEAGITDYWWADIHLEAVDSTLFNSLVVRPHSGDYFFLLSGPVTLMDGWATASVHQEWRPLQVDWGEVDAGSAIFVLDGFYWSANDTAPPGIAPVIDFFDDNSKMLYIAVGEGLDPCWTPDSGWNHLTFYGQVPPHARQATVHIRANFWGDDGEYPFALAFDDMSLKILTDTAVVGVDETQIITARKFALHQNCPNPFNSLTTIVYNLPRKTQVNIKVYNILGQEVETLVSDFQAAGYHSVVWKPQSVGAGVYFYRIEAGEFTDMKKCLFLK